MYDIPRSGGALKDVQVVVSIFHFSLFTFHFSPNVDCCIVQRATVVSPPLLYHKFISQNDSLRMSLFETTITAISSAQSSP